MGNFRRHNQKEKPKRKSNNSNTKKRKDGDYFSSYCILFNTNIKYEEGNPAGNEKVTKALKQVVKWLSEGNLKKVVFNRKTKQSYSDYWNPEHIKSVDIVANIEIGEKYNYYHSHIYLNVTHHNLPYFGIDYVEAANGMRDAFNEKLGYRGSRSPFVDFELMKTNNFQTLMRYLDKSSNVIETMHAEEQTYHNWMQGYQGL